MEEAFSQLIATLDGTLTHYHDDHIIVFKHSCQRSEVLVVANLCNLSYDLTLPTDIHFTHWMSLLDNTEIHISTQLTIAPYSYNILKLISY